MNLLLTPVKSLLNKLGLYPFARTIYRKISPLHRRDCVNNKSFFASIISDGDLCFDIGANVGQTIEALVAINARVVAIEPNPNCIPVLNYQFKNNPNVTILQIAMGASASKAKLNFTGTESTASMRDDWPFPNEQTIEVELSTLDNLIAEYGRPKLIKVDVEGFELDVFKGLNQAVPLIYFEMHGNEFNEALNILNRLSAIGEVVGVKVISGDNSSWLINEWVNIDDIAVKLSNQLPHHANIIVKMKV